MVSTALPTDLPELVDWQLAARVGRRVAGGSELPARAAWSRQFTELSTIAKDKEVEAEKRAILEAPAKAEKARTIVEAADVTRSKGPKRVGPFDPCRRTRPAGAPKRTSCASGRARGENPCVPTCSASSR